MNHDPVNHPEHYTSHPSGVEHIAITEHMGFCVGNAIKYLWRAGLKGALVEDLKKARWYIDREINRLERAAVPSRVEAPGSAERWGVFDGSKLIHGQITELLSRHVAEREADRVFIDKPLRVARIQRNAEGEWQELSDPSDSVQVPTPKRFGSWSGDYEDL